MKLFGVKELLSSSQILRLVSQKPFLKMSPAWHIAIGKYNLCLNQDMVITAMEGKQSVLVALACARKIRFETEQKNKLWEWRKIIFCTEINPSRARSEECSGKWWGRDLNRVWPLMVQLWWSVFSHRCFIQKPEEPLHFITSSHKVSTWIGFHDVRLFSKYKLGFRTEWS